MELKSELRLILESKFEMAKCFRTFSGAQNFSPELRAQIQKSHELSDECFLCGGLFRERNETTRQIGDSDWSQVMRFMKKFDIPPCLLGLGAFLTYVIGPAFSELICNKMANFGLAMPLSQMKYKFCDVEMAVLQLFIEIEYNLGFRNENPPNFTNALACIVEEYKLGQWPAEIGPRAHLQAVVLAAFFELEMEICDKMTTANKKLENVTSKNKHISDGDIDKIVEEIGELNGTTKIIPKKSGQKKVAKLKPRIVRTKFNKASKPKKSAVEDTTSVEGNKFHKRFRKTKRNVRV